MKSILNKDRGIAKYFGNSAWIMADSIITNGFSLVVLAVVARLLGPEEYGAYVYVFSLATLFSVVGQMGLDGILTRELVDRPDDHLVTLGTAGALRYMGYMLGAASCLLFGFVVPTHTPTEKALFVCAFFFILITPGTQIIENWFRSRLEARYASIAKMIGTIVGGGLKIALVLMGLGVSWVGFAQVITAVLVLLLSFYIFWLRKGPDPRKWSFNGGRAKELLAESWMIFVGSILAMIYLKIDQVMLRWICGPEDVGIYSIAARISEVFYFVPAALVATFFPRLIQVRKDSLECFNERFQGLLSLLAFLAYVTMVGLFVLCPIILVPIFGVAYKDALPIVFIHMLAMPFIFMRYAFSRWILVEKFAVFSIVSQGSGAVLNVGFNAFLIPSFGMEGAAVSTVISYCGASFLVLVVFGRTRNIFFMMLKSLVNPLGAFLYMRRLMLRGGG